jgi:transcriptional regulator with XRE-family HTH domain
VPPLTNRPCRPCLALITIPSSSATYTLKDKEALVSRFGDLVKKLRKDKGLTLEDVAKRIGSQKGYVSGIENGKVNPPSVKIIQKYAKVLCQDAREFVRLAWVDKAPSIIKEDAEKFLEWCRNEGSLNKVKQQTETS